MVEIKGSLLKEVLNFGSNAGGSGAYLQISNLKMINGIWQIKGKEINNNQNYWVAMNDYLTLGRKDIHFLNAENTGILQIIKPENEAEIKLRGDIRAIIIQFLKLKN